MVWKVRHRLRLLRPLQVPCWNLAALGELAQASVPSAGCRLLVLCSTASPSCSERSFTHGCTHATLQFQGQARPPTASLLGYPFSLEVRPLGSQSSLRRKGLGKRIMQASVDTSPELLIWELWGPRNPECSLEGGRCCGRPEGASAWL